MRSGPERSEARTVAIALAYDIGLSIAVPRFSVSASTRADDRYPAQPQKTARVVSIPDPYDVLRIGSKRCADL